MNALLLTPDTHATTDEYQCGYIALVGRPNVGKSTLLNTLIGEKISITSKKAQTTRHAILGIKTLEHAQMIYVDTPGLQSSEKNVMHRYMNRAAHTALLDADIILFMVEALRFTEEDECVFEKIQEAGKPCLLLINKVDKVRDKTQLLPWMSALTARHAFMQIVPLSAKTKDNVDALEKIVANALPKGPPLFPSTQQTDKEAQFRIAECIREKLMRATGQEVPYSTTVTIESCKLVKNQLHINAMIWVERDGQKAIVIGNKGERLKTIGTQARLDMERWLKQKVYLQLWVKVKNHWTQDETLLPEMGML